MAKVVTVSVKGEDSLSVGISTEATQNIQLMGTAYQVGNSGGGDGASTIIIDGRRYIASNGIITLPNALNIQNTYNSSSKKGITGSGVHEALQLNGFEMSYEAASGEDADTETYNLILTQGVE